MGTVGTYFFYLFDQDETVYSEPKKSSFYRQNLAILFIY